MIMTLRKHHTSSRKKYVVACLMLVTLSVSACSKTPPADILPAVDEQPIEQLVEMSATADDTTSEEMLPPEEEVSLTDSSLESVESMSEVPDAVEEPIPTEPVVSSEALSEPTQPTEDTVDSVHNIVDAESTVITAEIVEKTETAQRLYEESIQLSSLACKSCVQPQDIRISPAVQSGMSSIPEKVLRTTISIPSGIEVSKLSSYYPTFIIDFGLAALQTQRTVEDFTGTVQESLEWLTRTLNFQFVIQYPSLVVNSPTHYSFVVPTTSSTILKPMSSELAAFPNFTQSANVPAVGLTTLSLDTTTSLAVDLQDILNTKLNQYREYIVNLQLTNGNSRQFVEFHTASDLELELIINDRFYQLQANCSSENCMIMTASPDFKTSSQAFKANGQYSAIEFPDFSSSSELAISVRKYRAP